MMSDSERDGAVSIRISVFVFADISVRSPWNSELFLIVIVIRNANYRIKISKKICLVLKTKSLIQPISKVMSDRA